MKPWQAFLLGVPNPRGLDLNWIFTASHRDLENRHDWIQWAFPTDQESQFVDGAPVVPREEWALMTDEQRTNLRRCVAVYAAMLTSTDWWRHANDHNHLRISRVLRCLTLAGERDLAAQFYLTVEPISEANATSRRYWDEALNL